jgi:hypothetical protein
LSKKNEILYENLNIRDEIAEENKINQHNIVDKKFSLGFNNG